MPRDAVPYNYKLDKFTKYFGDSRTRRTRRGHVGKESADNLCVLEHPAPQLQLIAQLHLGTLITLVQLIETTPNYSLGSMASFILRTDSPATADVSRISSRVLETGLVQ